jgi:hypothetical protein
MYFIPCSAAGHRRAVGITVQPLLPVTRLHAADVISLPIINVPAHCILAQTQRLNLIRF